MLLALVLITAVDARITDAAQAAFGNDVRVTQVAVEPKLLTGAKDVTLTAMSQARCGKVPAVLSFSKAGSVSSRQVLLTLERERILVKTARDIQPGEHIGPMDIQTETTTRCDARDEQTLSSVDHALGMIARVRLIRGAPMRVSELQRPPAINAKDRIRLVISSGVLHASAPGEALQAGAIGQQIRVQNLLSSRTQVARIIDAQTAEVIP